VKQPRLLYEDSFSLNENNNYDVQCFFLVVDYSIIQIVANSYTTLHTCIYIYIVYVQLVTSYINYYSEIERESPVNFTVGNVQHEVASSVAPFFVNPALYVRQ